MMFEMSDMLQLVVISAYERCSGDGVSTITR